MSTAEYRREWMKRNPEKNSEYQRKYRASDPKMSLYRAAKQRAKAQKLPFDIEFSDLVFPERCPILGVVLRSYAGTAEKQPGGRADSFSLDRIVPELGYVKGNVQIVSQKANAMKNNATAEELKKFAEWVYYTHA